MLEVSQRDHGLLSNEIFELFALPRESRVKQVTIGFSSARTYSIQSADRSYFLKVDRMPTEGFHSRTLKDEFDRMTWLADKIPVPADVRYEVMGTNEYLLTSAIEGFMSHYDRLNGDIATVVKLLAHGLKVIHGLRIADCPFDESLNRKIAAAEERIERGFVNERLFKPQNFGRSARSVFAEVLGCQPDDEELVFTHGDYCLPNIILAKDLSNVAGYIDLDSAGVADRYYDLALLSRSLVRNWGEAWLPLFYEEYGLQEVDRKKIEFYQLLEELM